MSSVRLGLDSWPIAFLNFRGIVAELMIVLQLEDCIALQQHAKRCYKLAPYGD